MNGLAGGITSSQNTLTGALNTVLGAIKSKIKKASAAAGGGGGGSVGTAGSPAA